MPKEKEIPESNKYKVLEQKFILMIDSTTTLNKFQKNTLQKC